VLTNHRTGLTVTSRLICEISPADSRGMTVRIDHHHVRRVHKDDGIRVRESPTGAPGRKKRRSQPSECQTGQETPKQTVAVSSLLSNGIAKKCQRSECLQGH